MLGGGHRPPFAGAGCFPAQQSILGAASEPSPPGSHGSSFSSPARKSLVSSSSPSSACHAPSPALTTTKRKQCSSSLEQHVARGTILQRGVMGVKGRVAGSWWESPPLSPGCRGSAAALAPGAKVQAKSDVCRKFLSHC